jgi:hypothetical protein
MQAMAGGHVVTFMERLERVERVFPTLSSPFTFFDFPSIHAFKIEKGGKRIGSACSICSARSILTPVSSR